MKTELQANQSDRPDEKGLAAFTLVVAETGLGSVLHGLHIPFSGHFLSLNQIFFLSHFAPRSGEPFFAFEVSSLTALFKALSPAGKRLTPMLAISAQGALLNFGMLCLPGIWGCWLGGTLAALWAFIQPLALYWLFYGTWLVEMARFYIERVGLKGKEATLVPWIAALVAVKVVLAWAAVWAAFRLNEKNIGRYQTSLLRVGERVLSRRRSLWERENKPWYARALKEVFRPFFLLSIALTAFFLFQAESKESVRWWILMRPLAVATGLFFVFQALPWEKLVMGSRWQALSAFLTHLRGWQQGETPISRAPSSPKEKQP